MTKQTLRQTTMLLYGERLRARQPLADDVRLTEASVTKASSFSIGQLHKKLLRRRREAYMIGDSQRCSAAGSNLLASGRQCRPRRRRLAEA